MGNAYRSVLASGGAGTPITPSNSSPASMTGGETYTPTTNGVAVESVTNLTPANTSPPSISTGNIYKPTTSGKAIASIATNGSSVTPSSSGKYFYSGWNKMESSGYAYSSKPASLNNYEMVLYGSGSGSVLNGGCTLKNNDNSIKSIYIKQTQSGCSVQINGTSYTAGNTVDTSSMSSIEARAHKSSSGSSPFSCTIVINPS